MTKCRAEARRQDGSEDEGEQESIKLDQVAYFGQVY